MSKKKSPPSLFDAAPPPPFDPASAQAFDEALAEHLVPPGNGYSQEVDAAPDAPVEDVTEELLTLDEVPLVVEQELIPEETPAAPAPEDLPTEPTDFALFGHNLFGDAIEPPSRGKLSDKFVVPPFSVLDARQGYWQDRKRAWISLGIQSELGRGDSAGDKLTMSETVQRLKPSADQALKNSRRRANATPGGSMMPAADYSKRERGDGAGRPVGRTDGNKLGFSAAATIKRHGVGFDGSKVLRGEEEGEEEASGTSIFDPVVAELAYRWFCPPRGVILDPFAGGSVRGIVAALLERRYLGVDLSGRQLAANRQQAERICLGLKPTWVEGDSATVNLGEHLTESADLIFSCPPYGDLEVYSDHPSDLSAMTHEEFIRSYRHIIARYVEQLKPDRFACFMVGDFRDERGIYRNFIADTIAAFIAAGMEFYNEAILVTSVGSLPIRVQKMFNVSRKLGRTHQTLLVFCKGCPRRATEACNGQMELP